MSPTPTNAARSRSTPSDIAERTKVTSMLAKRGFEGFRTVDVNAGARFGLPESWECGVYVLDLGAGWAYVGQTCRHVATRLMDHSRRFAVHSVAFVPVHEQDLLDVEQEVHARLRKLSVRTMNRTMGRLDGPTRLDHIVPRDEQDHWADSYDAPSPRGVRTEQLMRQLADQKLRVAHQWDVFRAQQSSSRLCALMGQAIRLTIPRPEATEQDCWSTTCKRTRAGGPMIRLNVGVQCTFDVFAHERLINSYWWIPRIAFAKAFGVTGAEGVLNGPCEAWSGALGDIYWEPTTLVAAGPDQVLVQLTEPQTKQVLDTPEWILMMRGLHLMLMQQKANINSGSHCPQIADVALGYSHIDRASRDRRSRSARARQA